MRPARRGDATPIVALLAELNINADPNTVTWIISHPEMEIMVAADALDKVVGFITFSHRPVLKTGGRSGTIDELNVARAWKRRGVGRELLRKVVERAKVLSVRRLSIETYGPVTDELTSFFSACGFERTEYGVFKLK
ncbi:MAG TPA: GNAT family N-acetyltransferase [Archangium sp.]